MSCILPMKLTTDTQRVQLTVVARSVATKQSSRFDKLIVSSLSGDWIATARDARLAMTIVNKMRAFGLIRLWHAAVLFVLGTVCARGAEAREIVIDFEQAEIGKPVPTWTEREVVFTLAGAPVNSKAAGRVMFFPYLPTERKGILNAMAHEQAIPLQAKFPAAASAVTLVLWGSTGCPAKLQAFDGNGHLVAEASVPAVPARQAPADPVPQFELTVRAAGITTIQLSGPRNGEFLAVDEMRYVPATRE